MGALVNIGEAKTRLSELVAASLRGEDVVIARAGIPAVRLVPEVALDPTGDAKQAEIVRRRKAFRGKYKGQRGGVDWAAPLMSDAEVAAWEIQWLQMRRRIATTVPLDQLIDDLGLMELPFEFALHRFSASLPPLHGDAMDRMMIAQALRHDMTLVTFDENIHKYAVKTLC
jgi:antitoxin (DNA-binding transcriptional repressor) of toxin-antitoxin stability system